MPGHLQQYTMSKFKQESSFLYFWIIQFKTDIEKGIYIYLLYPLKSLSQS